MSIKQQKDIRKFLEGVYAFDTAEQIYKKQEDSLMAMLETVKNESMSEIIRKDVNEEWAHVGGPDGLL